MRGLGRQNGRHREIFELSLKVHQSSGFHSQCDGMPLQGFERDYSTVCESKIILVAVWSKNGSSRLEIITMGMVQSSSSLDIC